MPASGQSSGGRREGGLRALPALSQNGLRHCLGPSLLGYSQRAKEAFVKWNSFVTSGHQQEIGLAYLSGISFIVIFFFSNREGMLYNAILTFIMGGLCPLPKSQIKRNQNVKMRKLSPKTIAK